MELYSVCKTTGGFTEAAKLVRLHRGRHNACWAGSSYPEVVEGLWSAGCLWQGCWVPTQRLCWLVSLCLHVKLKRQLPYCLYMQRISYAKLTAILFVLAPSATSMKWTESASQTTCPLNRMCCDLESKQLVSLKSSSPAKSCTSGESLGSWLNLTTPWFTGTYWDFSDFLRETGCLMWVAKGQRERSGSTVSRVWLASSFAERSAHTTWCL